MTKVLLRHNTSDDSSCVTLYRFFNILILLVLSLLLIVPLGHSQPKKKRLKITKSTSIRSDQNYFSGSSFSGTLNDIITNSADTTILDPLTSIHINNLRTRALPSISDPDEFERDETRRAIQKTVAIFATTSLVSQLKKSDLRDPYRDITTSFSEFTNHFRYSLIDTTDGLAVAKNEKGRELLELSLKFNLTRGADPQISFSDSLRLRYDWLEQHTVLELGFNF